MIKEFLVPCFITLGIIWSLLFLFKKDSVTQEWFLGTILVVFFIAWAFAPRIYHKHKRKNCKNIIDLSDYRKKKKKIRSKQSRFL